MQRVWTKPSSDGAAHVFSLLQTAEAGGDCHFAYDILDQELDVFSEFELQRFSADIIQAFLEEFNSLIDRTFYC